MSRLLCTLIFVLSFALPAYAQEAAQDDGTRAATGGAQTLDDIMARQRGEDIDDSFRREATGDADTAAGIAAQLGTLGGASDPELWRALRYGSADINASSGGDVGAILVQDGGMKWLQFREGPLATKGIYVLGGTLVLLLLFYMIRGRVMIEGEKTGRTVTRFKAIERFGHWLMAGSFIFLGLTGLFSLFARKVLLGGASGGTNSLADIASRQDGALVEVLLGASKWVHNNVSWAFMIGLGMVFVMWVLHNLPHRTDIKWLAEGGGLMGEGSHSPAKKFNAGQKLIFWSVIIFGTIISVTGLALLFPFEFPIVSKLSALLNQTGILQAMGYGAVPAELALHEQMQFAQIWHALMAFVLMAIILAHIYIGSVGMEGAMDAMTTGEVEEQWAREHHSLWLEEISSAEDGDEQAKVAPAE